MSGARSRSERSSSSSLKNSGSLPKSISMNCCADIGVPSGCQNVVAHHVLDGPVLAVGKLDLDLSAGHCKRTSCPQTGHGSFSDTRRLWTRWARRGRADFTEAGRVRIANGSSGSIRLAVPFRIVEVMMRLHEVVDREIVLAVDRAACRAR